VWSLCLRNVCQNLERQCTNRITLEDFCNCSASDFTKFVDRGTRKADCNLAKIINCVKLTLEMNESTECGGLEVSYFVRMPSLQKTEYNGA
jgi:hypothetical protein